ncbi:MAG: peptidoglycan-binding protein [Heteroscytonema crispum UTEX LB 1556]
MDVQADRGLVIDGVIGSETWQCLVEAIPVPC